VFKPESRGRQLHRPEILIKCERGRLAKAECTWPKDDGLCPRVSRCFPVFVRGLKSLLAAAFARATAAGHHKLSLSVVLGLNVLSTLPVAADEVIEQRQIAAPHDSAFGTKRTSRHAQPMSVFGGKADGVI
jgi:hypothetical protein